MANGQLIAARYPAVAGPAPFYRLNVIDNLDGTCTVYVEDRANPDAVSTVAAVSTTGLKITSPGSASPGGVLGQVQYNAGAGAFGGIVGQTTDGTVTTFAAADLIASNIKPAANSVTAFQFVKADGVTNILNIDSTNSRVGIGNAAPITDLDISGGAGNMRIGNAAQNELRIFTAIAGANFIESGLFGFGASIDLQITGAFAGSIPNLKLVATNTMLGGLVNIGNNLATPVDALTFSVAPVASATHSLINLRNTALSGGSSNGTFIGANPATNAADWFLLQTNGATKFQMNPSGAITVYNSLTTAGQGLSPIVGLTSQKAETSAADANVLTVTPPAAVGTYRVSVAISVASATNGVIAWTLSWTDSNGNAQSAVAQQIFQMGTAAPNTTFTTSAAGNYYGSAVIDINNAGANIVVAWVGGGTTSAKISAAIQRLN